MVDLMPCPACGRNVMVEADRCKWCAADFRDEALRVEVEKHRAVAASQGSFFTGVAGRVVIGTTVAILGLFAVLIFWLADYRGFAVAGALMAAAGVVVLCSGFVKIMAR